MTVLEAYNWVQLNLNKLANNNNQNIPKYQFVSFFNTAQLRWFEQRIKYKETHTTVIDELQQFLKTKELAVISSNNTFTAALPERYAHYARIESYMQGCSEAIYSRFVRESDVNRLLSDEHQKPSADWGENLATIKDNKLVIYSDISLSKIKFVYYKYPNGIDMEDGYAKLDGQLSANIDPEIKDSNLIEVLNLTVRDIAGAINDVGRVQFANNIEAIHK